MLQISLPARLSDQKEREVSNDQKQRNANAETNP